MTVAPETLEIFPVIRTPPNPPPPPAKPPVAALAAPLAPAPLPNPPPNPPPPNALRSPAILFVVADTAL